MTAALTGGHVAVAGPGDPATGWSQVLEVARDSHLPGEIGLIDGSGAATTAVLGLADREKHRPHRAGARWLWASVTKQVTAILVMQQVESGTLALDRTIRTYLPEFAGPTGDAVTLRQLLQHTSGLPNPDDTPPATGGVPGFYFETGADISNQARALDFCAGTSRSPPGAGFSYNNCDYLILGAILERATGKPYARLVSSRIGRPLGLRSLRLASDGAPRGGGEAVGYSGDGKRSSAINVATFGAAGALTGTARDLLTLDRALIQGKLLTPASRAVLWQGDPKLGYEALGVWSFPAKLHGCAAPVALVERRGDVGGTQVRSVIAPALGRALVVFTNDDTVDFGEVWQSKGLSFDLLSAAFCSGES